ncbi:oxalate:formate antiporter [Elysia marginata]|uniref:Oxalate:formate antiporter n=1 Tax=Elysia marginata TaxID=1093978 RepID=A0AAV4GZA6_9GAST|nr:oxalate:formate antiporter [Elysia marginata]
MKLRISDKGKKYSAIVGAHLITAPFSFLWVYGNLSEYMDSYFRFSCSPGCMDSDSGWILPVSIAMGCPGTLLSKPLADRMGLRWAGAVTAIFLNTALFASAWTVQMSVAWTTVLLGVVLGMVQGFTAVVAFQLVRAWAPDKATLFMATTTGASTLLSMVQNQLVTALVNPNNLKPDAMQGSRTFFSQPEILDRVPMALILYAAMTLGLQFTGYVLLFPPPKLASTSENFKMEETTDKTKLVIGNVNGCDRSSLKPSPNTKAVADGHNPQEYGSHKVSSPAISFNTTEKNYNLPKIDITVQESQLETARPFEDEKASLPPSKVLKTPIFYAVFVFGIATVFALILKANFYKQFGLLYIHNDQYLTLVGTLIPVVATLSRLVVGMVLNKKIITIKDAIIFSLAVNCFLCAFWYFVPQLNALLYLFFVLGLASVQSLYFVTLPVATMEIFGPDHFSTNYGLLLTNLMVVGILSPVVISPLMHVLGWFWLFGSASILCLVSLVLVVCADFNPPQISI